MTQFYFWLPFKHLNLGGKCLIESRGREHIWNQKHPSDGQYVPASAAALNDRRGKRKMLQRVFRRAIRDVREQEDWEAIKRLQRGELSQCVEIWRNQRDRWEATEGFHIRLRKAEFDLEKEKQRQQGLAELRNSLTSGTVSREWQNIWMGWEHTRLTTEINTNKCRLRK